MIKQVLFYLLFLLSFSVFSQDNILKRQINFTSEDRPLEHVLLGIANVGDFSFSYNPLIIPGDSMVNLKVEPFSAVLSTPISPCISSTSLRQMASPSPVPP